MSKVDKAYLKQLVETPSVTGTETRIASVVRERLSEVADEIETNVMGSVHARLVGSGSAPSVMIAAIWMKSADGYPYLRSGILKRCSCRRS